MNIRVLHLGVGLILSGLIGQGAVASEIIFAKPAVKELHFENPPEVERVVLANGQLSYVSPKRLRGRVRRVHVRKQLGAAELWVEDLVYRKGYAFAVASSPDLTKRLFELGFVEKPWRDYLNMFAGGFTFGMLGAGSTSFAYIDHSVSAAVVGGLSVLSSAGMFIKATLDMKFKELSASVVGNGVGGYVLSHVERDPTSGEVLDFVLETASGQVRYSMLQEAASCSLMLRSPKDSVVGHVSLN